MREQLQGLAMWLVDAIYAGFPRPVPDSHALTACKLIAHRGAHDNHDIIENTMAAFSAAQEAGVWGIECDLRWTRDLVPVIHHDADGSRTFGCAQQIAETDFSSLRQLMPMLPTLAEVIALCKGRTHLMLEIKDEHYPEPVRQAQILETTLSQLCPGEEYHLLALAPGLFTRAPFVDREYCFPVSEVNVRAMSAAVAAGGYGGLNGHYLLLGSRLQRRHEALGQRIGTGFISSRNALFRELNRGIEWIFTDDAIRIQRILDEHRLTTPQRTSNSSL